MMLPVPLQRWVWRVGWTAGPAQRREAVATFPALVVCEDCDLVHARQTLVPGDVARCSRCGALLGRGHRLGPQGLLALSEQILQFPVELEIFGQRQKGLVDLFQPVQGHLGGDGRGVLVNETLGRGAGRRGGFHRLVDGLQVLHALFDQCLRPRRADQLAL